MSNKYYRSFKQLSMENPILANAIANCFDHIPDGKEKPVFCNTTGKIYKSIDDAWRYEWSSYLSVVKSCINQTEIRCNSCGKIGIHYRRFTFAEDLSINTLYSIAANNKLKAIYENKIAEKDKQLEEEKARRVELENKISAIQAFLNK